MRHLLIIAISFLFFSFNSNAGFRYNDTVTLSGVVSEIKYEIPTGDSFTTYILKLDKTINVKANDKWVAKNNVYEIHLNIMNDQVQKYKDKKIVVTGSLFGALNIHHIRDVCIRVDKIDEQ